MNNFLNKFLVSLLLTLIFSFQVVAQPADVASGDPVASLAAASGMPIKGPWDAAGSIAAIEKMYETMVIQLQELKTQSEFLSDMNTVAKESLRQYDAVRNVSLNAMQQRLNQDKESMTQLDNLAGKDSRTRLLILSGEIDRRIEDPTLSSQKRAQLKQDRSMARTLLLLEELNQATDTNLMQSTGATNEREDNKLTSQSLAILAKLKALEDRLRYEQYVASQQGRREQNAMSKPSTVIRQIGMSEREP
ncbi:MAG TPA: hypothetical protein ENK06_03665 [Gammaproteobacteria bacterium]|nr:hypothetical protein [Gammaproteobacteria bacterium]